MWSLIRCPCVKAVARIVKLDQPMSRRHTATATV